MRIFVATSYSSKVDYSSGEVFPDYKAWLETILGAIEELGIEVFCALREDGYKINNVDPAAAFRLDFSNIDKCDALLALVDNNVSGGVQAEIGYAMGRGKKVYLAHTPEDAFDYLNNAMVSAGAAQELFLPVTAEEWRPKLSA